VVRVLRLSHYGSYGDSIFYAVNTLGLGVERQQRLLPRQDPTP